MKLVSSLFASLGKVGDMVDPDVTSNLEIPQTVGLVIAGVPLPHRSVVLGSSIGNSAKLANSSRVANAGQVLYTVATLQKGVWRISGGAHYYANHAVNLVGANFVLAAGSGGAAFLATLMQFNPCNGTVVGFVDEIYTLMQDTDLQFTLGANGVGQDHFCAFWLNAQKLL